MGCGHPDHDTGYQEFIEVVKKRRSVRHSKRERRSSVKSC